MPSLSFSPSRCMQESQEIAETRKPNPLLNYCAWKLHMLDPSLREAIKQLNSVMPLAITQFRLIYCFIHWCEICHSISQSCLYQLPPWLWCNLFIPGYEIIMFLSVCQPEYTQAYVYIMEENSSHVINIMHLKLAWNSLVAVVEYYCSKSVDLGPWLCD